MAVAGPRLEKAIRVVTDPATEKTLRKNVHLQMALDTLEENGRENGFSSDQIDVLIDVACGAKYAETVCMRVLKSLIPKEDVSAFTVIKAVSWINCLHKGPPLTRKVFIIRWLLLVYDLVDNQDQVHLLYNMLFPMIEYVPLCPFLCHLLYKMTREDDVVIHRVQKLNTLIKEMGDQSHLLGLLSVYKSFKPHLVSVPIPRSRKAFFKKVDRDWAERIKTIQQRTRPDHTGADDMTLQFQMTDTEPTGPRTKRRKLVPEIESQTVNAPAKPLEGMLEPKPFEQIKTVDDLIGNIERIELPCQIAGVLDNHLLQFYVGYLSDRSADHRLSFWLANTLTEEFLSRPANENLHEKIRLLRRILVFEDKIKEGIPVVERFIHRYLLQWNGDDFRECILGLLTRLRIQPFEVLNEQVFEPLRQIFFRSSVYFKCQVLVVYKELLRNFAAHEGRRHTSTKKLSEQMNSNPYLTSNESVFLYETPVEDFEPLTTILEFVEHVSEISVVALQLEGNHPDLVNHTLMFFETASTLQDNYDIPLMLFPSPSICNACLFSFDASIFVRILDIILRCGAAVRKLKKARSTSDLDDSVAAAIMQSISQEKIQSMNAHITDVVHAMWKNNIFFSQSAPSLFTLDKPTLMKLTGTSIEADVFALPHHPALVGYANRIVKNMRSRHQSGDTTDIWVERKDEFLNYLEKHKLSQVKHFFNQFIRGRAESSK
ncbi:unnamed protein product [Owenia fusiformis]|uniref:Uncharacterized protein n=1 Tax=Owenia fusiformis TaxID=6347 RepID=A0A8J1Y2J8_OWEFU|nr:unnamed protein product [Owenia fusiformis]